MKKYFSLILLLLFTGVFVFAQEGTPPAVSPTEDFLKLLMESIGGMKGASALAISALVVQLLIKLLKLPLVDGFFSKLAGTWKLVIVMSMTLISGVLSLMVSGVSFGAAVIHSTTLSAFMVLGNEIYKHFVAEKKPVSG